MRRVLHPGEVVRGVRLNLSSPTGADGTDAGVRFEAFLTASPEDVSVIGNRDSDEVLTPAPANDTAVGLHFKFPTQYMTGQFFIPLDVSAEGPRNVLTLRITDVEQVGYFGTAFLEPGESR